MILNLSIVYTWYCISVYAFRFLTFYNFPHKIFFPFFKVYFPWDLVILMLLKVRSFIWLYFCLVIVVYRNIINFVSWICSQQLCWALVLVPIVCVHNSLWFFSTDITHNWGHFDFFCAFCTPSFFSCPIMLAKTSRTLLNGNSNISIFI